MTTYYAQPGGPCNIDTVYDDGAGINWDVVPDGPTLNSAAILITRTAFTLTGLCMVGGGGGSVIINRSRQFLGC